MPCALKIDFDFADLDGESEVAWVCAGAIGDSSAGSCA
jgi:hypothetical protein